VFSLPEEAGVLHITVLVGTAAEKRDSQEQVEIMARVVRSLLVGRLTEHGALVPLELALD
jgi:hypothetical protein